MHTSKCITRVRGLGPLGPVTKAEALAFEQKSKSTSLVLAGVAGVGVGLITSGPLGRWLLAGAVGVTTYALLRDEGADKKRKLEAEEEAAENL